jgi:hypothetical protein
LLAVTVRDHGIGIPERDRARLFERYFRGTNATGIAGSGVGLHLVAMVLELHGGSHRCVLTGRGGFELPGAAPGDGLIQGNTPQRRIGSRIKGSPRAKSPVKIVVFTRSGHKLILGAC